VRTFAQAERTALFVGSGVSAESGLPPWREFILTLLERAFDAAFTATADERRMWAHQILESQGVTGAAAVVKALTPDETTFTAWLLDGLYGGSPPTMFQAGPIALAAARLRRQLGAAMVIATTNYDDLMEKALRSVGFAATEVRPYIRRRSQTPTGVAPVVHLHGYAGSGPRKGRLVLSEEEYTRMQSGAVSWQEEYVTDLLRDRPCLFVGTSLADPNLIRYLYGYGGRSARHWAVLSRQSEEPRSGPVAEARERALAARWAHCGVQTLFVDHYSDVAQLLHEVRVAHGAQYVSAAERAAGWISRFEDHVLGVRDASAFSRRQEALSDLLSVQLTTAVDYAQEAGVALAAVESLALSLWIARTDGRRLACWASSHQWQRDPQLVRHVPTAPDSTWAAAGAYCRGTPVRIDIPSGSPWGCALAVPLYVESAAGADDHLPVGAIQLSSSARLHETHLMTAVRQGATATLLGDEMMALIASGVAESTSALWPDSAAARCSRELGILTT
jgi:hypothetical protein